MTKKIYDVAILGAGVSGAFASYKLSKYNDVKTCIIDFGRPPGKRRKQLQGWFGCFPYSNARLYLDDYKKVSKKTGNRIASSADRFVKLVIEDHGPTDVSKNKVPESKIIEKIEKLGYKYDINSFCQWKPENIHSLSRQIARDIEKRVDFYFDTNVEDITKKNGVFTIKTENETILAKKVILSVGRSGWRFARDIYKKFGLIKNNDYSYFGFRGEVSVGNMKKWNKSHCTVYNDKLCIGPLSWHGTVIPEDHYDLVISSWRSNEERLGKLAFILSDNRVGRNKVKDYLNNNFDISLIPEYEWFKDTMGTVDELIPNFSQKGYFYIPELITGIPKIKINKKLSTEIDNLHVAGESAGISGILGAAISGCIAADNLV